VSSDAISNHVGEHAMTMQAQEMPDKEGFFGEYGGQFVPPELKRVMDEINDAYDAVTATAAFQATESPLFCAALDGQDRGRADFSEARGSEPHGGAQD
jgi:tryptophan synthase beta chain